MTHLAVSDQCETQSTPPQDGMSANSATDGFFAIRVSDLSDSELQERIQVCAEKFLAAQQDYEDTGDMAAIGERDRWWLVEAEALRERGGRQRIVARMERERGLS
jgi:hypothetical protein